MNGGNEDIIITQSNIIPNSFDSAKHNDIVDAKIGLREMKIQCPEKIIVGHLNINSIRHKFNTTILNEEGKTVSDKKELCRTFSTYFANIVSDLQFPKIQDHASNIKSNHDPGENHDPVLSAVNTFQNHPSVVNIKQREFNSTFSFKNTNENEVRKIIKNLNVRKTCQGGDIPTKIMKLNIYLFSSFICQNFNYCISIGKFQMN